jgi:hypothetical protein
MIKSSETPQEGSQEHAEQNDGELKTLVVSSCITLAIHKLEQDLIQTNYVSARDLVIQHMVDLMAFYLPSKEDLEEKKEKLRHDALAILNGGFLSQIENLVKKAIEDKVRKQQASEGKLPNLLRAIDFPLMKPILDRLTLDDRSKLTQHLLNDSMIQAYLDRMERIGLGS